MLHAPLIARIANRFSVVHMGPIESELAEFQVIRGNIPGWSHVGHYAFFQHVVALLPQDARILVCGVYHGLDLRLIETAAEKLGKRIHLSGVDLFSDKPCADWPPEKRGLTWEQAFACPPPSMTAAHAHAPTAQIVKGDARLHLCSCAGAFDFIYLDTSHDFETVRHEIRAAKYALRPGGILGGDDYTGHETGWGVDRAVQQELPYHLVFFNRIWLAQP
jgi:hypothetical protein